MYIPELYISSSYTLLKKRVNPHHEISLSTELQLFPVWLVRLSLVIMSSFQLRFGWFNPTGRLEHGLLKIGDALFSKSQSIINESNLVKSSKGFDSEPTEPWLKTVMIRPHFLFYPNPMRWRWIIGLEQIQPKPQFWVLPFFNPISNAQGKTVRITHDLPCSVATSLRQQSISRWSCTKTTKT